MSEGNSNYKQMTSKAALLFYYPEETESEHQDRLIQRQLTVATSIGKALFGTVQEYHCPRDLLSINEACKQIGSSEVTTILCFVLCVPLDKKSSGDLCFKLDRKNKLQLQQHLLTPLLQAKPQGELNVYVSIDTTFVDPLLKVPKAEALLPGMDALCEAARLTDGGRMKLAIVAGCKGKPPTGVDTEAKDEGSELDSDDEGEYSYMPAVPRFTEIAIAALLKAFEVGDGMAASITNVQQIANKYLLRAYEIHNMKKGDVRPKLCDLIQCSSASPFLQLSPEAQELIRCGAHFPRADNFFAPYDVKEASAPTTAEINRAPLPISMPGNTTGKSPVVPSELAACTAMPNSKMNPSAQPFAPQPVSGPLQPDRAATGPVSRQGPPVVYPNLEEYTPMNAETLQDLSQKFATSIPILRSLNPFLHSVPPNIELHSRKCKIPIFGHVVQPGETASSIYRAEVSAPSNSLYQKYLGLNGWHTAVPESALPPGTKIWIPFHQAPQTTAPQLGVQTSVISSVSSGPAVTTPHKLGQPSTAGHFASSALPQGQAVITTSKSCKGMKENEAVVPIGNFPSPSIDSNGMRTCPQCNIAIEKDASWTDHVGVYEHLISVPREGNHEQYLCRICHAIVSGDKNVALHLDGLRHKRKWGMTKECPECKLRFLCIEDYEHHRRSDECGTVSTIPMKHEHHDSEDHHLKDVLRSIEGIQ